MSAFRINFAYTISSVSSSSAVEDGFIDSPSHSPSASAPASSTSSASDLPPTTNSPPPLTLHTGPNTLIHTPLSQYLHGNISFVSFRVQVLTIRDEHLARLASNSNTLADGISADGSSADSSQAAKQGQSITDVEQQWRETLEEVDKMKPGVMRVKGKNFSGGLNELREQIYRLTKRDPLHGYSVEDFLDAAAGKVQGEAESDEEGTVDDYADMHEVSE